MVAASCGGGGEKARAAPWRKCVVSLVAVGAWVSAWAVALSAASDGSSATLASGAAGRCEARLPVLRDPASVLAVALCATAAAIAWLALRVEGRSAVEELLEASTATLVLAGEEVAACNAAARRAFAVEVGSRWPHGAADRAVVRGADGGLRVVIRTPRGDRVAVVAVDVTKEIEKERAVFNQFVHEMRSKLTPAQETLEMVQCLAERGEAAELERLAADAEVGLALLAEVDRLVETRLELHKVYAGNYVSHPNVQVMDLRAILLNRLKPAAALANRHVAFRSELPDGYGDADVFVSLDFYMWSHIVNNLLSNARKHTSNGAVTLAFLEDRGDMLHFAVRDTGRGIPDPIKARLFKEEVVTSDPRGVGLGLVSCQIFAEAIGGRIWLEWSRTLEADLAAADRHGAEFRFCLPGHVVQVASRGATTPRPPVLDRASLAAVQQPASPLSGRTEATPPYPSLWHVTTVHIVEDSPTIRTTIRNKFAQCCRRRLAAPDDHWTFLEHDTVESILPLVDAIAPRTDVLVTVDQNLDACGGRLRGSDLVRALVNANFKGLILSVSGLDGPEHLMLGADLDLGKPLPAVDVLFDNLAAAYDLKQRALGAARPSDHIPRSLSCPHFCADRPCPPVSPLPAASRDRRRPA